MNDSKIKIRISISKRLLSDIELNVSGKNRSEKLRKCTELGYELLTKGGA